MHHNVNQLCVYVSCTECIAKQDRQCTCNLTWGAFAKPLLPWKNHKYCLFFCVFVRSRGYLRVWWVPWRVGVSMCAHACSLPYPAFNAYAPYCPLWRFCLYHIFRHYLINVTIFGKKLLYIKCVFWFSVELIWNISYSKKKSARYCHKCENVFM